MPATKKLPVDERHWQKKQVKFRLNADNLSLTTGAGKQHAQIDTDHQLQPIIPWKRKTPITWLNSVKPWSHKVCAIPRRRSNQNSRDRIRSFQV